MIVPTVTRDGRRIEETPIPPVAIEIHSCRLTTDYGGRCLAIESACVKDNDKQEVTHSSEEVPEGHSTGYYHFC